MSMFLTNPSSPQLRTTYGRSGCTQTLLQERSWRAIVLLKLTTPLCTPDNITKPSLPLDTIRKSSPSCVVRNLV